MNVQLANNTRNKIKNIYYISLSFIANIGGIGTYGKSLSCVLTI